MPVHAAPLPRTKHATVGKKVTGDFLAADSRKSGLICSLMWLAASQCGLSVRKWNIRHQKYSQQCK